MSTTKEMEIGTGEALIAGNGRLERRRPSAVSRPAWSELNRAHKAGVIVYSVLFASVVAFVVTVLAAAA
jgi:hypothetical protein